MRSDIPWPFCCRAERSDKVVKNRAEKEETFDWVFKEESLAGDRMNLKMDGSSMVMSYL